MGLGWLSFAGEDFTAFDVGGTAVDANEVFGLLSGEGVVETFSLYWAGVADLFGWFGVMGLECFGDEYRRV